MSVSQPFDPTEIMGCPKCFWVGPASESHPVRNDVLRCERCSANLVRMSDVVADVSAYCKGLMLSRLTANRMQLVLAELASLAPLKDLLADMRDDEMMRNAQEIGAARERAAILEDAEKWIKNLDPRSWQEVICARGVALPPRPEEGELERLRAMEGALKRGDYSVLPPYPARGESMASVNALQHQIRRAASGAAPQT